MCRVNAKMPFQSGLRGFQPCVALRDFIGIFATVMELVDMRDSKFLAFGRGGSTPPSGTKYVAMGIVL